MRTPSPPGTPLRVMLATGNPHKVAELRALFTGSPRTLRVLSLDDLSPDRRAALTEPAETGATFEDNAAIKALSYAAQTGELCLADDSGLEVDALAGAPGVISSHYCTGGTDSNPPMPRAERDRRNNALLLERLLGVPDARRTARFVCVMALAAPPGHELVGAAQPGIFARSRGCFEGAIGVPPRVPAGDNGFGYDPLFLVGPDFTRTAAELPAGKKNLRSHRAAAAAAMLDELRRLAL